MGSTALEEEQARDSPVTDEARTRLLFAWFALLSRGSTATGGLPEEGADLGKGLGINHPLPLQAGPGQV